MSSNPSLGLPDSVFYHTPLLTDFYQITMLYAYWKNNAQNSKAVFDLFFRKCPFKGEFAIFAGLKTALQFISNLHFTDEDIAYLKGVLPQAEKEFFDYLKTINSKELKIYSLLEGTIAFPTVPLLRIEGPLGVAQLIETPLLNIVGFPTLVATNARRMRIAAGPNKTMMEFGLRRAQASDGAMSASYYSVLGGFDRTSNTLAGKVYNIEVSGTHAHAFVMSFSSLADVHNRFLVSADGKTKGDLIEIASKFRTQLGYTNSHEGEFAAFISYASAFPRGFCALVDTYNVLSSGVPNFVVVALALNQLGYPVGAIRLDSGDLAYLSKESRKVFKAIAEKVKVPQLAKAIIVVSNDINEETLYALNMQKHEIDSFGIGTNLVTCQNQPALGCVYKLVQLDGVPKIKISEDVGKMTCPARKQAFRLFDSKGTPVHDLLVPVDDDAVKGTLNTAEIPVEGKDVLCRHPTTDLVARAFKPAKVVPLHHLVWDGQYTAVVNPYPTVDVIKKYVEDQIAVFREDHLRQLNPTPYKVSVSQKLFDYTRKLLKENREGGGKK